MRTETPLSGILLLALIIFCIYAAVKWFWPLILVAAAIVLIRYLINRKKLSDAEKAERETLEAEKKQQVQQDLLQKRTEENQPQVIDAEFTAHEKEPEESRR